jgi:biopolymer transport protein TolR
MSSMRGGRSRKFKSEINVVPYIDVMLVLLVIFMVVAPLTTPGVVNLPTAEKTAQPPTEYIEITMRSRDLLEIGIKQQKQGMEQPEKVSRDALMQKLSALHTKNPEYAVLIAAEKDSNYGDVIQLISDAKKAGISRVGLATK